MNIPGIKPSAGPDALPPGTRLDEFVITRTLGTSGFGIVYLVTEPASKHQFVIKEYLPLALIARAASGTQLELRSPAHADVFEQGRRAFIEESQLLTRCDHPSLLRVTRGWEANGTAYRAMPYHAAAESLLKWRLSLRAPPDEAFLRSVAEALMGALGVLHRAGRIHGHISPAKILLTPSNGVVLLGFGAARQALVGKPNTAPSNLPSVPSADLYALAATLHYLVSGRPAPTMPHSPPTSHEPLAEVVRRLQRDLPQLHYSASFINAIDTALSLQPRERPQSLAQFRAMLAPPNTTRTEVEPAKPSARQAMPLVTPRRSLRRSASWIIGVIAVTGFATVGWTLGHHQIAQNTPVTHTRIEAPLPDQAPLPYTAPTTADATLAEPLNITLPEAPTAAIAPTTKATHLEDTPKSSATPPRPAESTKRLATPAVTNPRQVCGERTPYALYRCVQTLCGQSKWTSHAQCQWLHQHGEVSEP